MTRQEKLCQDLIFVVTEAKNGKYGTDNDIDSSALEEEFQEIIDDLSISAGEDEEGGVLCWMWGVRQ